MVRALRVIKKIICFPNQSPGSDQLGQMAIFVALIFQVLFVFFAMVVNVGLLVHHKINLQSSADLAAYYGAMRQAEMLNASAHINYQIRQTWKLFVWRYRTIGMSGDETNNPFDGGGDNKIKNGEDTDDLPGGMNDSLKFYYDTPPFCVAYDIIRESPGTQNLCKLISSQTKSTKIFDAPKISGVFPGISILQNFEAQIASAAEAALKSCGEWGGYNYLTLAKFAVAYKMEVNARKSLLLGMTKKISETGDDFLDIDGESVREGSLKVLKKNLTAPNQDSLKETDFKFLNSLGVDGCNAVGVAAIDPPRWLSEIKIAPTFSYADFECKSSPNEKNTVPKSFPNQLPYHMSNDTSKLTDKTRQQINEIRDIAQSESDLENALFSYTAGFEKNPWCLAYVGVAAKTAPNIPFSPFGSVTLEAKAYAKPFGGKFGPWYNRTWGPSESRSNGDDSNRIESQLPRRYVPGEPLDFDPLSSEGRQPNFNRYPGDQLGMRSRLSVAHWAMILHELARAKVGGSFNNFGRNKANATDYEPAIDYFPSPAKLSILEDGDALSWNSDSDTPVKMRELEMLAVAPDVFDTTYYSIEPNFYENYYKRITAGKLLPAIGYTAPMRPDFGGRLRKDDTWISYGVKDQIAQTVIMGANTDSGLNLTKWNYLLTKPEHLLTSWIPKSLLDYSLDETRFGKCDNRKDLPSDPIPTSVPFKWMPSEFPNPGDCVVGGRTGYSVKLTAESFLKRTDLPLGGDGGSTGAIINVPPDDF